jgi:hypothetical protein
VRILVRLGLGLLLVIGLRNPAVAGPQPMPGSEDIPRLLEASSLVCKGEVVEAPELKFSSNQDAARFTALATIQVDRCFKGKAESFIHVYVDEFLFPTSPTFTLEKGAYRLFFLKPRDKNLAVVDEYFGALPISKLVSSLSSSDPAMLLEADLKAGLGDSDPERVLDSIRMLGNLRRGSSRAALRQLLPSADALTKTYIWQAQLRVADYSDLGSIAQFLLTTDPPRELVLPRDRLFAMYYEIVREIGGIHVQDQLRYLEQFAVAKNPYLREGGIQALRGLNSIASAQTLLMALNDSNPDNAFSAMQGLVALTDGGDVGWFPDLIRFRETPDLYAAKCREWWEREGKDQATKKHGTKN